MEKRNFQTVIAFQHLVSTFFNCFCYWIKVNYDIFDLLANKTTPFVDATSGYCDGNCKNFIFFISLFSFFVFMHSTSEVGSMLLIMRCTDPKGRIKEKYALIENVFNADFVH